MLNVRWIVGGTLVGASLLWAVGGVILAEGALRVPRRPIPAASMSASMQTREIRARDGARLRAWIVYPQEPSGNCVIVLHGISDSRQSSLGFVPLFTGSHYTVLLPDSRGHGESGGDIVTYGVLEADDVRRWVDLLMASEGCQRIFGLGESLGGGILLQALAVERRFRAVVAECPFSSLERIGQDRVGELIRLPPTVGRTVALPLVRCAFLYCRYRYGFDPDNASPETAVGQTRTPILLIHGLDDPKTPAEHSRILASKNPGIVLWLVPGAGHTNAWAVAPEEFPRRVLSWFASHS
jgi:pimeloyl-ACP methyl ester carboxylesterase